MLILPRRPLAGAIVTGLGCLAGLLPTMWTVVVPVLLIALAVAAAIRAQATLTSRAATEMKGDGCVGTRSIAVHQ